MWKPCPPHYVRRWAVQGVKPGGDLATTIFDLRYGRAHVAIYPATVDTFALLIDRAAVDLLATTVESRNACAVMGMHALHGPRLLGLRPYQLPHTEPSQGPLELYVHLPNDQIHIIYGRERLAALQDALTEIISLMR